MQRPILYRQRNRRCFWKTRNFGNCPRWRCCLRSRSLQHSWRGKPKSHKNPPSPACFHPTRKLPKPKKHRAATEPNSNYGLHCSRYKSPQCQPPPTCIHLRKKRPLPNLQPAHWSSPNLSRGFGNINATTISYRHQFISGCGRGDAAPIFVWRTRLHPGLGGRGVNRGEPTANGHQQH